MDGKPKARETHAWGVHDAWRRSIMDNPRGRKSPVELGFPEKLHAWHGGT